MKYLVFVDDGETAYVLRAGGFLQMLALYLSFWIGGYTIKIERE